MTRLIPLVLAGLPAAFLVALAGCHKSDNQPGPGGLTVGEAKALDAAADQIESEAPPAPASVADAPTATPGPTRP